MKVYNPEVFYPIPWTEWRTFYDKTEDFHMDLKKSHSMHLWGKHSSHISLESLESGTLLYELATKHCPLIFGHNKD